MDKLNFLSLRSRRPKQLLHCRHLWASFAPKRLLPNLSFDVVNLSLSLFLSLIRCEMFQARLRKLNGFRLSLGRLGQQWIRLEQAVVLRPGPEKPSCTLSAQRT